MKRFLYMSFLLVSFVLVSIISGQEAATESSGDADTTLSCKDQRVVVTYFHMNRRCPTCEKLEAYSSEAVASGFAKALEDSTVIWLVVNFEAEGNEHFAEDYQLFSQSLVLSKLCDGKEVSWTALGKIWDLVGDKAAYVAYVQKELDSFIDSATD